MFVVVALVANTLAGVARARAAEADQRRQEADQRRREADLAAERAHALAELQAALRRVATLVARGVTPSEVFSAVATELARCLGVYYSALVRYEPDGAATLLAARDDDPGLKKMPVGARFSLEGDSVAAMVFRTGRPARMDSYENAPGSSRRTASVIWASARGWVRRSSSTAGCGARPSSARRDPNPCPPTPRRGSRTSPISSRPRSPTPRPMRNSPRLGPGSWRPPMMRGAVSNAICTTAPNNGWCHWGFSCAPRRLRCPPNCGRSRSRFPTSSIGLVGVSEELQEISRGIHPAILSKGGLGPALKTLARRSAVPVELDLAVDRRLPESAEVAAYYVVAEALTNAAKHARASQVTVRVEADGCQPPSLDSRRRNRGSRLSQRIRTHRSHRPRRGARRHDGDLESARKRDVTARRDPSRGRVRRGCGKRVF